MMTKIVEADFFLFDKMTTYSLNRKILKSSRFRNHSHHKMLN